MSLDLFFDFLAMKLDGPKAAGQHIVLNFDFPDTQEKYVVEMVNGVLNHTPGRQAKTADATITPSPETLNQIVLKQTTPKASSTRCSRISIPSSSGSRLSPPRACGRRHSYAPLPDGSLWAAKPDRQGLSCEP
jgi:hypothetical protein